MTSAVINAASSRIGTLLTEEVKFLWNVKPKVEMLQHELLMASSFMKDAESLKHNSSEVIRTAISEIRDLAYEAEDIIERYCVPESLHRQDEISDSVKWLCCIVCNAKSLHEVGSDIDALIDKLSYLNSQLQRYNIIQNSGHENSSSSSTSNSTSTSQLNRTFSISEVDDTVGLVRDATILVDQLVHKTTFNVISISGMGGLGKSTLAKKAFKDLEVVDHFKLCAWVFVSQQFEESNVFRSILMRLFRKDEMKMNRIQNLPDDMLQGELHEILQSHKCLVVLDDIWRLQDWRRLNHAFHSIHTSPSKLLITTRNENLLAGMQPPAFLHQLQLLSAEDSTELFLKKTLRYRAQALDDKMKRLGDEMVKKCRGLPLAIVALSGILSNKKYVDEWKDVHDNMESYLNDESSQLNQHLVVSKVLELSYNDLPHHLRLCFLHMACFPEDFEIPVKRLWHLWEAENFLIPLTKDPIEVGRDYLNQLVQRCLVQVGNLTKSGKIKTCHLHDMMREMCMSKGREENFIHVIEPEEDLVGKQQKLEYNASMRGKSKHRLAMHPAPRSSEELNVGTKGECAHVRSLLVFNSPTSEFMNGIEKVMSPLLRVLDLEEVRMAKFPEEIKHFVHLRYLSLKNTGLRKLPLAIGTLKLLQTLDLRTNTSVELANELWKMERLVHLYLPAIYKCIDGSMLRLRGLKNLETLINLSPQRTHPEDVDVLNKLKRISFTYNPYPLKEERSTELLLAWASISSKPGLKKAIIVVITGTMLDGEPEMLTRFSEKNKINFSMCQLSLCSIKRLSPLVFPSSLCVLILKEIEFEEDPMSVLEKLPHLRCLALFICPHIKRMVCTSGGFPRLKILVLYRLVFFDEWKVEEGAMLNLTQVCIDSCPGLRRKEHVASEVMTIMMERKMIHPRLESEQLRDPDMKKLYKLCSGNYTEEGEQALSMIEDLLNQSLSSGKLSPSEVKKILYLLGVSWEILTDGRVIIKPHDATCNYVNGELLSFRKWTWTY